MQSRAANGDDHTYDKPTYVSKIYPNGEVQTITVQLQHQAVVSPYKYSDLSVTNWNSGETAVIPSPYISKTQSFTLKLNLLCS